MIISFIDFSVQAFSNLASLSYGNFTCFYLRGTAELQKDIPERQARMNYTWRERKPVPFQLLPVLQWGILPSRLHIQHIYLD
jgi:hypothetical protein